MKPLAFAIAAVLAAAARADQTLTFDGAVPDAGDFFVLPFDVPAGTAEIEVRHDDLSADNILDWGLDDPAGFRGWGGGNVEPAVVGIDAASRSYLRGPLPAGTWRVVVGKAKIVTQPAQYHVEVILRDAPTLTAQGERGAYQPGANLHKERRWYAGDFHVHSKESGDAQPALDVIADFARGRGLDFVELSDHNTVSQDDFVNDAQSRHPDLLLIPGIEYTTYYGHANAVGATGWLSHRIGFEGATVEAALEGFHAKGGLFSINHPVLDLGMLCIGCAWKSPIDVSLADGVEIATGGWKAAGHLFDADAIKFWDAMLDKGSHATAMGGSDDHRAGTGTGAFDSPIGSPTTMVLADELSAAAIVDGVRHGRTVVKLQGPEDPMLELTAGSAVVGDAVSGNEVTLGAKVTGGKDMQVRFVRNGSPQGPIAVTADTFEAKLVVRPAGPERWRAEVVYAGHPQVVTGHLWLTPGPPARGCGCGNGAFGILSFAAVLTRTGWRANRPGGCAGSPRRRASPPRAA